MYTRGEAEYLDVETDIRGASVFQERVWSAMRDIPCGARMSYGEIARNLGAAGAYRAVGNACAANPLPLVFPCHRVVGVRTLGGFSSGLSWKVFLLNMEKKHAEKGISLTGDEKKGKIAQGAE
jgi:methylated-DNA-[protein]-cysteine S-methyltransferase